MTLIPVSNPSKFPASDLEIDVSHSVADVEAWGKRRGAETVYYYQHTVKNMITAAIVVVKSTREI